MDLDSKEFLGRVGVRKEYFRVDRKKIDRKKGRNGLDEFYEFAKSRENWIVPVELGCKMIEISLFNFLICIINFITFLYISAKYFLFREVNVVDLFRIKRKFVKKLKLEYKTNPNAEIASSDDDFKPIIIAINNLILSNDIKGAKKGIDKVGSEVLKKINHTNSFPFSQHLSNHLNYLCNIEQKNELNTHLSKVQFNNYLVKTVYEIIEKGIFLKHGEKGNAGSLITTIGEMFPKSIKDKNDPTIEIKSRESIIFTLRDLCELSINANSSAPLWYSIKQLRIISKILVNEINTNENVDENIKQINNIIEILEKNGIDVANRYAKIPSIAFFEDYKNIILKMSEIEEFEDRFQIIKKSYNSKTFLERVKEILMKKNKKRINLYKEDLEKIDNWILEIKNVSTEDKLAHDSKRSTNNIIVKRRIKR